MQFRLGSSFYSMFGNILGNEQLKEILARLRQAGRVPNAMLFTGPDGVGKRLFALEMARSFVCRAPDNGLPCGECPACLRAVEFEFPRPDDRDDFKRVIFSNHPDVGTVIPHGRNISVDAIRALESEAHFRPYEGDARTFIIDNADKMNDAASNALLKTLEEPASTSHIILVSSRPDSLLPTIRSRCQTFRFAPVEAEKVARFVAETKGIAEADARLAARMSQGSVGAALTLDVAGLRNRRKELVEIVRAALVSRDRLLLLRASEKLAEAKNKEFFEDDLGILESLIHDVWSIAVGRDRADVVNADLADELAVLAEGACSADIPAWLTAIQTMRENFIVNINRKIATDSLLVGVTA